MRSNPPHIKTVGALRALLTREGYVAAGRAQSARNVLASNAGRPETPYLSEGWNDDVFDMVGQRVKAGVDDAAIEAEALTWRQPGYSEQETLAEVRDMIRRWRPLYRSANKDHPRSCVFAGSTNEDRYLRERNGGASFSARKGQAED